LIPARSVLVLLLGLAAAIAHAQSATLPVSTLFTYPWASGESGDEPPTTTPDGRTRLFQRSDGHTSKIFESHLIDGRWSRPVVASFSGSWLDQFPTLSPDGSYLIFESNRPLAAGDAKTERVGNLWRVDRTPSGWSAPMHLPDTVNISKRIYAHSVAANGDIYFMSSTGPRRGKDTGFSLFRAARTSEGYALAEALPFSEGSSSDVDPYIAPDQSYLIFASDNRREPIGHEHLFIVFHHGADWGPITPIRYQGDEQATDDNYLNASPDGKILYFDSSRGGTSKIWTLPLAPYIFAAARTDAVGMQSSAHERVTESIMLMGGKPDLRQVNRMRFDAKLVERDIVQNEHTGEPYMLDTRTAVITDDFAAGDRLILTRIVGRADFSMRDLTTAVAEQHEVLKDGIVVRRVAGLPDQAWEMRDPFRALLLADKAADLRTEPDEILHDSPQQAVSFTIDGFRTKILLDARTKLITATQSLLGFSHATADDIAENAMGDVRERTEFMVWQLVDGLRYPKQWDTYQNDVYLQTLLVDAVPIVNPARDPHVSLDPETAQQASRLAATDVNQIPLGNVIFHAPDPHRGIEEIAPGIVQIPGSWYTTLVKQDDGIVIIDAPISSGYSAEVIQEAERRYPHVPIKAVITSTAFFWHIAGIREYVAHHIPIYVRDANESTVRRILGAPHTLVPDELAQHPVSPILRVVSERTKIGRGKNAVFVMPIAEATEPMLMTYIPDARMLHTGELIQPLGPKGALLYPESLLEIRDAVLQEKLQVDRLIGMHMSPISWKDLELALAKDNDAPTKPSS